MKNLLIGLSTVIFISASGMSLGNNIHRTSRYKVENSTTIKNEEQSKELKNQYILENSIFDSKDDAIDWYLKHRTKKVKSEIYDDKFEFNGDLYDSYRDIYSDLPSDLVKKISVNQDPYDYIVDTLGRVSPTINRQNEKLVNVYKGKDDQAYLTRDEALKNYLYAKEVYDVNGKTFYSHFDAYQYLKNEILDITESQTVYKVGQSYMNQEDLKKAISRRIHKEYIYNNQRINAENINSVTDFKLSESELKQVKEIKASSNQYWIDFNNKKGVLSGPQYIETNEDLSYLTDPKRWNRIGAQKIGFTATLVTQTIKAYVDNNFADKNIAGSYIKELLAPIVEDGENNSIAKLSKWADKHIPKLLRPQSMQAIFDINNTIGKILTNIDKLPISGIVNAIVPKSELISKLNEPELQGEWNPFLYALKNEEVRKRTLEIIAKYKLTANFEDILANIKRIRTMPIHFRNAMFVYNWIDTLIKIQINNKELNDYHNLVTEAYKETLGANDSPDVNELYKDFDAKDIADFILNPKHFQDSTTNDKQSKWDKFVVKLDKFVKTVTNEAEKLTKYIKKNSMDLKLKAVKVNMKIKEKSQKIQEYIGDKNESALNLVKGLEAKASKALGFVNNIIIANPKVKLFIQAFKFVDNLISLQKKLTYEIDLPDKRKITYTIVAFDNVFSRYTFDPSDLLRVNLVRKGVQKTKYQSFNKYFATKDEATTFAKTYVLSNLEEFAEQINLYDSEQPLIKQTLKDKKNKFESSDKVEKIKQDLVEHIFKTNYAKNKSTFYGDGLGGWFARKKDAEESLSKKLQDITVSGASNSIENIKSRLKVKYEVEINGQLYYYNSKQEALDQIKTKQFIEEKQVFFSKLRENTFYDKLDNATNLNYIVYMIEINKIKYYFTSEFAAKIFYIEQIGVNKIDYDYQETKYILDDKVYDKKEMIAHIIKQIHEVQIGKSEANK